MGPDECEKADGSFEDEDDEHLFQSSWEQSIESGDLKQAINQFIWLNANPKWSVGRAENIAVKIFGLLTSK